jgi:hypothetical protein
MFLITRPWIEIGSAALSLSPLDLAEWLTLVPDVRFGADAMQTPFALRFIPALLVFALTLIPTRRFSVLWAAAGIAALAGVLLLLPPIEYFTDPNQRADINYTQLFHVGLTTIFLAGLGLSGLTRRFIRIILPITLLTILMLTLLAVPTAQQYVLSYGLQSRVHIELWVTTLILWSVTALLPNTKKGTR